MCFYLGRLALRQRSSFGFIFGKLWRVFALRSWHHMTLWCRCCEMNDVYGKDSGDLAPKLTAGQKEGDFSAFLSSP